MDMLCHRIKKSLGATQVMFYMFNKWQLDQRFTYFSTTYPVTCFKEVNSSTFTTHFNQSSDITKIDGHVENPLVEKVQNQFSFLAKVYCLENFYEIGRASCRERV